MKRLETNLKIKKSSKTMTMKKNVKISNVNNQLEVITGTSSEQRVHRES